jgi:hypothetical protein
MNRRNFLKNSIMAASGMMLVHNASGSNFPANSFFRLEQRDGHWWFISPQGEKFWSIGINHIDSATLRYKESGNLWEEKYGNSMKKWLKQVKNDITSWNFNSVGWVQEVVTREAENHRHSRSYTFEEYQWLDMPYGHMLPVIDSDQWEVEIKLPDVRSKSFSEWVEYVARDECSRLKDDPKLMGYFYVDCPVWIHTIPDNEWRGSLLDPDMEKTEAGRKEMHDIATAYYKTLHDTIRRYDKNHLIFGDRYELNRPLSKTVLMAARPYVDAFSFQCFKDPVPLYKNLKYWADILKMPVFIADSSRTRNNEQEGQVHGRSFRTHDTGKYEQTLKLIREIPECVGFHLCGAYARNFVRRSGLKNHVDKEGTETVEITRINGDMEKWILTQ